MKSCVKNGCSRIVDNLVLNNGSGSCRLRLQSSLKSDNAGTSSKINIKPFINHKKKCQKKKK